MLSFVRAMEQSSSPASPRGLDDSVGSAANDPDMGHGLLQREVSRLEKEVASLKTKLRNAQDQVLELEKVRALRSRPVPGRCVCAELTHGGGRKKRNGTRGSRRRYTRTA